ncbi:MAG: hypothetical protein DIU56_011640 [Pseudomonadota bacterium]|nr:MAG: hypothetical protein DIU56_11430 [Pseudomonadota bacterium]
MRTVRLIVLSLTLLAACTSRSTPEAEVRALIARGEEAAEARDTGAVMALVSEQYSDELGRDRQALRNFVRGFFLVNQRVRLLTRIESIEFPEDGLARVRLVVGMLGTRGDEEDWSFAAELHELDIELVREGGEWRVLHARRHRPGGA